MYLMDTPRRSTVTNWETSKTRLRVAHLKMRVAPTITNYFSGFLIHSIPIKI